MGQAKKRGTFEERRQQSIERTAATQTESEREEAAWLNSLTDDQRRLIRANRERRDRRILTMLSASIIGGQY